MVRSAISGGDCNFSLVGRASAENAIYVEIDDAGPKHTHLWVTVNDVDGSGCPPFVLYYSRDCRRAGRRQQEGVPTP